MRTTTLSVGVGFGRMGEEVVRFVREWGTVHVHHTVDLTSS